MAVTADTHADAQTQTTVSVSRLQAVLGREDGVKLEKWSNGSELHATVVVTEHTLLPSLLEPYGWEVVAICESGKVHIGQA